MNTDTRKDFFFATITGSGFVVSLDIVNAFLQFGVLSVSLTIGIYGLISAIKKHKQNKTN